MEIETQTFKKWQKILMPREKIIYEFSIGEGFRRLGLVVGIVIGIITAPLYGLGVIIILASIFYFGWYLKIANIYAFTNKRILIYQGWLSTHLTSVDYNKITDIKVKEPLFDKILAGDGSLIINTAGSDLPEITLFHISQPYEKKKKLDKIRAITE